MQAFVITAQVSTFLLATPREWDYRTCYKAARGGHRDLLVWAMNNGAYHKNTLDFWSREMRRFQTQFDGIGQSHVDLCIEE